MIDLFVATAIWYFIGAYIERAPFWPLKVVHYERDEWYAMALVWVTIYLLVSGVSLIAGFLV